MKTYQYFLFDLDGTLTDSAPGVIACVRYALEAYGYPLGTEEELRSFVGPPLLDSFMRYCGCDREEAKKLRAKYRERYNPVGVYENALLPGIPEILEEIRARGGVLAVASSKPLVMVKKVMEKFGLTDRFTVIVGSDEEHGVAEEKEAVIREVFRRLAIGEDDLPRVLMIGDRCYDVEGAHACGIDCLGATVGYGDMAELEEAGADYIACSMEEMKEMLQELVMRSADEKEGAG